MHSLETLKKLNERASLPSPSERKPLNEQKPTGEQKPVIPPQ